MSVLRFEVFDEYSEHLEPDEHGAWVAFSVYDRLSEALRKVTSERDEAVEERDGAFRSFSRVENENAELHTERDELEEANRSLAKMRDAALEGNLSASSAYEPLPVRASFGKTEGGAQDS